jgi:hypothetical protein
MRTASATTLAAESADRVFRLSDAMILMAALGVALVWDRGRIVDPSRWISDPRSAPNLGLLRRLGIAVTNVLEFIPPLLAVASVTVLGLRLRRPRPPLYVLAREPGTVACAVASLVMIPACLAILASHLQTGATLAMAWNRAAIDLQPENLGGLTFLIGLAIAVTWFVMSAKRRWLAAAGWLDRLGRLVGVGWMLMIIGVVCVRLIYVYVMF